MFHNQISVLYIFIFIYLLLLFMTVSIYWYYTVNRPHCVYLLFSQLNRTLALKKSARVLFPPTVPPEKKLY